MKGTKMLTALAVVLAMTVTLFAAVDPSVAKELGREIIPLRTVQPSHATNTTDVTAKGTLATISWLGGLNVNTNFGGWTNDYFMEYYVPGADGNLKSIDFNMSDLPDVAGGSMSIFIVKGNYAWPEISTLDIADACGDAWLGYYNEASGMEVIGDAGNWVKGGVNALEGANPDKNYDPLGEQLWPFFGGVSAEMAPNADDGGIINVLVDGEFEFLRGDTFIVVVRFNGFPEGADANEYRAGFMSAKLHYEAQPGLKFYNDNSSAGTNGRCGDEDYGWYIRSYVWDWTLNVEYTGDRAPVVVDFDKLPTTLSTADRQLSATITDDDPSGDTAGGVAVAKIVYSIDGGDAGEAVMAANGDGTFTGTIPGQVSGTAVSYYIYAEDAGGLSATSLSHSYTIFEKTAPILFFYDDESIIGFEWYYFYNTSYLYSYDLWEQSFGPLSSELLENYCYVVHIMGGGPTNQTDDIGPTYKAWLDAATAESPRCLFISGQDYGYISGYADTTFPAGTFEYDYLGVETLGPQDANYDGTAASYKTPYAVDAVADDPISGFMAAYAADSLQLFYDPYNELGFYNWIDNMTLAAATTCYTDPNNDDATVAVYNSGATFKTAFWTIDPLALSFYSPADTSSMYHWALLDVGNPMSTVLDWFGDYNAVEPTTAPAAFKLNANYPNPFNPTTTLSFEIPSNEFVTLTVYNMLGQEVKTLVNSNMTAGYHSMVWNGRDMNGKLVGSGIYLYTLKAGDFTSTQKMIFLK